LTIKTGRPVSGSAIVFILVLLAPALGFTQAATSAAPQEKPALFGQPLADFTLHALQGGEMTLSSLRGKNVMIIFLRGYASEGNWCTICHYQYAELAEMELKQGLRGTHNLEVLFLLPYDGETVKTWAGALPAQVEKIHGWKYPADPDKLDDAGRARMERSRRLFPKDIGLKAPFPVPFPILIDANGNLSKTLGLFRTEWGGSKVAQNVPTVILLDGDGVVRYKYLSQSTVDRPSYAHLLDVLGTIAKKT
jgi:peroxiredoxin